MISFVLIGHSLILLAQTLLKRERLQEETSTLTFTPTQPIHGTKSSPARRPIQKS